MSATHAPVLDAIAFQLIAALEQYERDTTVMIERWPDLETYQEVSDQIETIRMYSSALDEARVQWVELLIAHAELVHFLWRAQGGLAADAAEQMANVRDRHADCVVALRNRCLRLIHRSPSRG